MAKAKSNLIWILLGITCTFAVGVLAPAKAKAQSPVTQLVDAATTLNLLTLSQDVSVSPDRAKALQFKYQAVLSHPEIPQAPLLHALDYYDAHPDLVANKNFITVVNFSLNSDQKRMFLIDMRDGNFTMLLVAHGIGSDPNGTGKARVFSNVNDSLMSSLGLFVTADTYEGANGHSLVVKGLEATNNLAEDRHILVHGANYVSPNLHPLGPSEGCFAVEQDEHMALIEKIQGGSLIISWIDPSLLNQVK